MIDRAEMHQCDVEREIAMMQRLQHPSVAKLHAVFPSESIGVCLVMELYRGGDMINAMTTYWKKQGMIPIDAMRGLSKQMWDSIAYVHSMDCVHCDVKGDNFMMDHREITTPNNRIYLSDFGTVCDCRPNQRLTKNCGTRGYWSPEFYGRNYAKKVD